MRLVHKAITGLVVLGAVLLGHASFGLAEGQSAAADQASAAQPSKNLPADFIDSRPIIAYFDDRAMPDTVRGLLEELQRPDRCGQGAAVHPDEACALVFYKLDEDFEPAPLRPPFIMRAIYRITTPDNPANTAMLMPNGQGDMKRYVDGDLYEPLRNIRANICRQDRRTPDQCRATDSKGVLYRPYGILGKGENDREGILPVKSAGKHFLLNLKPADAEWVKQQMLLDLCTQHITCP